MRRWRWQEWRRGTTPIRLVWSQGLLVGALLLVSLWLGSLIWGLAGKARIAFTQEQQARDAYRGLEARKATLEANLATLATPRGQDAAIRQAFSVAKPGEEVIVVVPPATTTSLAPKPWWQRVLNWF